jgi:hypothetical protein
MPLGVHLEFHGSDSICVFLAPKEKEITREGPEQQKGKNFLSFNGEKGRGNV